MKDLDLSEDADKQLREDAQDFRKNGLIMRYARDCRRGSNVNYASDDEENDSAHHCTQDQPASRD